MRRAFQSHAIAALLVALTVLAGGARAGDWRRVTSANFEVAGDAADADLIATARRLEQFRSAVTGLFPQMKFRSPAPTVVVVYANRAGYERVRPVDWSVGLFQGGETVNYIALSADRGEREFFTTVYHEYTHFLTDNALGRSNVPPWLNEGLAEYYERTEFAADATTLGGANPAHLALLRREGIPPPSALFGVDYYSLQKQTKETAQQFYAASWLLVHYLIHGRANFADVIAKVGGGTPVRAALGMTDDEIASELAKYLRRTNFATTAGTRAAIPADALRITAVAPAAALAIEGDLLARIGRAAAAEATLRAALAIDAAEPLANTALGMLLLRGEKFYDARIFLERAVKAAPDDYRPYFALAYAVSRTGMTEFGFVVSYTPDEAEIIYANARRAIELKPDFAESYNIFALVCAVRFENVAEGLEMIGRAIAIAPGNQWYQLRRAELLTRRGEFGEARAIAMRVAATASTDQLKLYAENSVRNINALAAAAAAERDANKPDPDSLSDAPLGDEEIARRRAKALNESLNESLRQPRSGERRLVGEVLAFDCAAGRVTATVRGPNGIAEFRAASFERVHLVSYSPDFVNQRLGCGARPSGNLAVVTFRPSGASGGELVAVEFVPPGFSFLR